MPEIGVLGGLGLYTLLDEVSHITIETPYGDPSAEIAIGIVEGREVAFLPRHGRTHTLPPAAINYRANLWAMRKLGVERIIAASVSSSLQAYVRPGVIVVCDQFVDRTWGRADSFVADGPDVAHVGAAEPYCQHLRELALQVGGELGLEVQERGTVVVVQGPRLPSRAESRWFAGQGWDIVSMTQYPEVILARELEICYVNISLVGAYEPGVAEAENPSEDNRERVSELILSMVPRLPTERTCACPSAMNNAFIGG